MRTLCSGTTRAKTFTRRTVSRSASGDSASSCGAGDHLDGGTGRRHARRGRHARRRARVVARDHDRPDARRPRLRDRGPRRRPRRVGEPEQADRLEPALGVLIAVEAGRRATSRTRRPRSVQPPSTRSISPASCGRSSSAMSTSGAPFTRGGAPAVRLRRSRRSCACARSRKGGSRRPCGRSSAASRVMPCARAAAMIASSSGSACSSSLDASTAASRRSASVAPGAAHSLLHREAVLGQRPGLVTADDGRRTERLDGGEPADDRAALGHLAHAQGERDRHDGRQALRQRRHRQRHPDQHAVGERVALEVGEQGEHRDDARPPSGSAGA